MLLPSCGASDTIEIRMPFHFYTTRLVVKGSGQFDIKVRVPRWAPLGLSARDVEIGTGRPTPQLPVKPLPAGVDVSPNKVLVDFAHGRHG